MEIKNCHDQSQVTVVMVPFPAQGHLNQLLHLSRLISSYGIPVHYIGTATHNRQARLRIHGWNPLSTANIHFHEFQTPPFLSPPPNPISSIKFPSHLQPLFNASSELRRPVEALLRALAETSRRIVVIHDSLMASVIQDVVLIPNAESYNFQSVSAFAILAFLLEDQQKPFPLDPDTEKEDFPTTDGCFTPEFTDFAATQYVHRDFNSGNIYNTCNAIEGPYMDLISKELALGSMTQWALGPFNPVAISQEKDCPPRHRCLEWLDKQYTNSVIFVSFGTTTSFSEEQIKEIAFGLEKSNTKFIWVLRDADKGDLFSKEENRSIELPKGYEERMAEMGMVVSDWAPQLEILGHTSTGGFLSHCGWNSCMESISMGVPIAAWPMHSDQPFNSFLVTKLLKAGVVVKEWAKRNEIITSSTIEEAVRKLMDSKEGDQIRKRASELGSSVQRSVGEDGVSRVELDSFLAHITR